jgi:hypothetical protein
MLVNIFFPAWQELSKFKTWRTRRRGGGDSVLEDSQLLVFEVLGKGLELGMHPMSWIPSEWTSTDWKDWKWELRGAVLLGIEEAQAERFQIFDKKGLSLFALSRSIKQAGHCASHVHYLLKLWY